MPSPKFMVALALAVLLAGVAARADSPDAAPPPGLPATGGSFEPAIERARSLEPLQSLLISLDGTIVVEESFRGHSSRAATNIKSASKSVISALVGIAIERGLLEGPDQPLADILGDRLPPDPDPRLGTVTIGNLLSMQAGLERTSGRNYGAWVRSPNWVRAALAKPFADAPGGAMLYSTGNSHLLSAILTKASGRSTRALLEDWLGPAGVEVSGWQRDPQGIYLGGNEMAMTPRSLLAFGEL
jgi:CubicO group peptidase (beta-lactamase class C family)